MRQRGLLVALAELEGSEVAGEFERHTSLRWEELRGSAAGGRWGARRTYEVMYLGRPRASVLAEAYRHLVDDELDAPELAARVTERRVLTCEVGVTNVLDLRPPEVLTATGLTLADLRSDVGDYDRCQAVGSAAHQLGFSGVLAPSASGLGETLALFLENLPAQQLPRLTKRELWNGLPPDPRQLRLADEDLA